MIIKSRMADNLVLTGVMLCILCKPSYHQTEHILCLSFSFSCNPQVCELRD